MPEYKVAGSFYGPAEEGADRDGYLRFFDVIEAENPAQAREFAWQDYGEHNHVEVQGEVESQADRKRWLARNPV